MNAVSVHQAVLADLDDLASLFDRYRQFQGKASDLAAARAFLSERFNHQESVLFIARLEQKAVGFAQLFPSFSSVALQRVFILNDLFVEESGRGVGAASQLLAALEQYAWSFGAVRVSLNVAIENTSAQNLYASRGWKKDDQFFMFHRFPPEP